MPSLLYWYASYHFGLIKRSTANNDGINCKSIIWPNEKKGINYNSKCLSDQRMDRLNHVLIPTTIHHIAHVQNCQQSWRKPHIDLPTPKKKNIKLNKNRMKTARQISYHFQILFFYSFFNSSHDTHYWPLLSNVSIKKKTWNYYYNLFWPSCVYDVCLWDHILRHIILYHHIHYNSEHVLLNKQHQTLEGFWRLLLLLYAIPPHPKKEKKREEFTSSIEPPYTRTYIVCFKSHLHLRKKKFKN